MKPLKNKKGSLIKKFLFFLVTLLLVAGGVGAYIYMSGSQDQWVDDSQQTDTQRLGGGGTSSPKDNSNETAPTPQSNITPLKPSGTFVSNHRPNLSGSPAPNTITSTCTTTPGAKCTIEFKNGDIVKSLPSKTADANGNVDWSWKLQDIGLTEGVWTIVAIARIGTNTAEASDALSLVVGQ